MRRIGSSNCLASTAGLVMVAPASCVCNGFRIGSEVLLLFFGRCVRKEVTTADFRSRQILKQTGTAQWRMKLDVEVKTRMVAAIGWRLMQRHHVRKGHLPKVVEPDENLFQQCRKVAEFIRR